MHGLFRVPKVREEQAALTRMAVPALPVISTNSSLSAGARSLYRVLPAQVHLSSGMSGFHGTVRLCEPA